MVVKIKTVLIFVAVVCAASVGFILLYNPKPAAMANELMIEAEPVAMGPEVAFNSDLQLISEGEGAIEVTPYKSSYADGEMVRFTARPLDGWAFDHWEGDVSAENADAESFAAMMSGGQYKVVAVFVTE